MKSKILSMTVVVVTALGAPLALTSTASAQLMPDESTQPLNVCDGNTLSTVDHDGEQLSDEALDLALRQVRQLCDAGVGSAISIDEYIDSVERDAQLTDDYANVVAQINTRPGNMGISAYANSIPLDKLRKELSCIYRMQPVTGPSTSWESCGSESTSTGTYLTTRGNDFCPVPGTRWEAVADLYVNGSLKQSDGAIAVAL
ncbi:hypothetical protein GCM10017602_35110 [Herbiconiux flava]|nr:hypothetical protein GCM10017602_35110 [Herbiconiux flava]